MRITDFDLALRRYVGASEQRPTLEHSIATTSALHERFEDWLAVNMTGSAIPHISAARLQRLPVWLPSIAAQRKAVEQLGTLWEAARQFRQLADLALEIRDEMAAAFVAAEPGDQREEG